MRRIRGVDLIPAPPPPLPSPLPHTLVMCCCCCCLTPCLTPLQVNPLAGPQWGGRVARLHQAWAAHLFDRDADITPVMACASLVPGVWSREYTGRLQRLPQQMAG